MMFLRDITARSIVNLNFEINNNYDDNPLVLPIYHHEIVVIDQPRIYISLQKFTSA